MSIYQVLSRTIVKLAKQKALVLFFSLMPALVLLGSLFVFVYSVQAEAKGGLSHSITKPLPLLEHAFGLTLSKFPAISSQMRETFMLQSGNEIGVSGTLKRVSLSSAGVEGNDDSFHTVLSGDGRYTVFTSEATNLVAGDSNGLRDAFVYDRETGQTRRLACSSEGSLPTTENDGHIAISRDGTVIACTNAGEEEGEIIVYRNFNSSSETSEVAVSASNSIFDLSISADGRYIAFTSTASDLVPNDTNGYQDAFVYDSQNEDITRISMGLNDQEANHVTHDTAISDDGQFIAFASNASNLVSNDTNNTSDIFLYSQQAETIERISVGSSGGQLAGNSTGPSLSADGSVAVFETSHYFNLDLFIDLVVWRQGEGTEGILVASHPFPNNLGVAFRSVLSGDGRFIIFHSNDETLASGDNNGYTDVYLYDRETDEMRIISTSENSVQGNDDSLGRPTISYDGSFVAYSSAASNLVADDTNNARDVFLLDRRGYLTIYPGQDWNVECPFCSVADTQQFVNGINPRTGNFVHGDAFLKTPVAGDSLAFSYMYISEARDLYTTTMGYGWGHYYEMSLDFDSTALTHTVVMRAPGGSRFPYYGNGDGTYQRYPGVTAALIRTEGANPEDTTYEVTTYNQFKATFDYQGRLIEREDPNGNAVSFTYADFNGTERLYRASQGSRYLEFDYYPTGGRLHTVTDNANRTVTLSYQGDDLHTVTDPGNAVITYEYDVGDNLLTEIVDGTGVTVKQIFYDNQDRAYRIQDGEGNILVDANFGSGSTLSSSSSEDLSAVTVVTATGTVMTFTYGVRGTLIDVVYACDDSTPGCQSNTGVSYDYNFKQSAVQDANGNPPTELRWNDSGSNLEYKQDTLGHETFMTYDTFNNLTQTIDARLNPTTYTYKYTDPNDPNWPYLPTFRSGVTDTLGNTTVYTPTIAGETGPIDGLPYEERDANGAVTRYGYNAYGQITQTVRALGTPDAITTTYGYDAIGRLITTTQTSALESQTAVNAYNANNRLIATIANWQDLPHWTDCTFDPGPRDENVCTLYRYDDAGRTISTTNALGQTNLTFYNDAGQVVTSVVNYDGLTTFASLCTDFTNPDPEYNLCSLSGYDQYGRVVTTTDSLGRQTVTVYDALGRSAGTIVNSVNVTTLAGCVFPPSQPDRDLCTLYQYDNVGNTVIVTDTLGRMTYTEYDALNRVSASINNWDGGSYPPDMDAECTGLPRERDFNICTWHTYDEMGNTIFVTNTLTQTTRTFYDELNRVVATVANWQPGFNDPSQCNLSSDNTDDKNVCTVYGYDAAGNQITTTNALSQTTLTVYDAANRPFLTVQNWDGTAITAANWPQTCDFPPAVADVNVCAVTFYDSLGRRSASQDALGNVTAYDYDGLGRVITTTQTLTQPNNIAIPITRVVSYNALGNQLSVTDANGHSTTYEYDSLNRLVQTITAEGITSTQAYNAAGWVITRTNGLGYETVTGYDLLGRRLTMTNPLSHLTTYTYDALGNQVQMVDAEGVTTTYANDGLNRLTAVIENDVPGNHPASETDVQTQYVYDALGNRVVITNALGFTSTTTLYDGLNRPVVVADALGNQMETAYNALGLRAVITDANDARTEYSYDGLNRVSVVTYLTDGELVTTTYDALGHRLAMTDSVGVTTYAYDNLYRLLTVTNPFNEVVGYRYDRAGNRTHLIYPDGRTVTYTYDLDNRLVQVADWDGGFTSYGYDAAGRLLTTTLPNGVATVYTYDTANRLTELTHTDTSDGLLLARYEYGYDNLGNRTAVTETMRLPQSAGQAWLPAGVAGGEEAPLTAEAAVAAIQPEEITLDKDHMARPSQEQPPPPEPRPQPPRSLTTQPATSLGLDAVTPPFDPVDIAERARNRVQTGPDGRAFLIRPAHTAHFAEEGALTFVPMVSETVGLSLTLNPETPLTVSVALAGVRVGTHELSIAPVPGQREVTDNVVRLPRGPRLVEEFIAGDGGIEQRWQVENIPNGWSGDLVLAVEATTAFSVSVDDEGFVFAAPTLEGESVPVVRYGRALAIDASGAEQWAQLSMTELTPAPDGRHRYLLQMSIPAAWLAAAQYPLLIDPLLSNLVRLEQSAPASAQQKVEVAYNSDQDEFLLAWEDYRNGNWDIYAQRVNGDGALLGENFIITNATYRQSDARLAYGNGIYLVAWRHFPSASTNYYDVYATIISGTGQILTNSIPIATDSGYWDRESPTDVVFNSTSGEFLVLWQDRTTTYWDAWGRHVASNGNLGSPIQITSQASWHEENAALAYNPDDDEYLIVWRRHAGGSVQVLEGQRLDGDGTLLGSVIDIGDGSGFEQNPDIIYLAAADRYVVVWNDTRNSGSSSYDIYGQLVNADGSLDGSNFVVSAAAVEERLPRLAVDANTGGALVVWRQSSGGSTSHDLYGRLLDSNGDVAGNSFIIQAVSAVQEAPVLAQNGASDFLVAWQDERHGNLDIFTRMRLADGSWGGAGMAHPAPGDQEKPQVAYNPDDDEYLVVWQDYRSGADWDIYGQLVAGDGSLVGQNIAIDTTGTKHQIRPYVAYGTEEYLVAWQHYTDNNNTTHDVYGRVISRTGSFVTSAFVIANSTDGGGRAVLDVPNDVVYNSGSDQFLVLWQVEASTGNWNISGRHVSPTGATGSVISIAAAAGSEQDAAGAYNPDDDQYLVVWDTPSGQFDALYGRRLTGGGTVTTTDAIAISTQADMASVADLVYLAGTEQYYAVWMKGNFGFQNGDVQGRAITPDGSTGSTVTLAATSRDERQPRLAVDSSGALLVWQKSNVSSGYDLYGQALDASGLPDGDTFTIQETAGDQQNPAVAYGSNLRYQLAWQDDREGEWDLYTTSLDRSYQFVTIQYDYDPLYRLTSATYSGDILGTYGYEHDALGNRTVYTATITSTIVTTYSYNAANQLVTAKADNSPDTWYYVFDGNGNQVRQVPNGLTPANGETRYTFDQRNRLVQAETHDGSNYQLQAEAVYDGQNNRVQTISHLTGSPVVVTYTVDIQNRSVPLVIDYETGNDTLLLYGLFGVGEYLDAWQYYLGDAQASVRQLTDSNGDVTLGRTYDAFGLLLQQTGSEAPVFGFAGAQAGVGGLLYINGRYFDPATGRFLSPDNSRFDPMRPGTLNGYLASLLLANPGAMLFPPFLILSWRKRKIKGGHYMLLLLAGIGLGLTLSACGQDGGGTSTPPSTPPIQPPTTPPPSNTPPPPSNTPPPTSTLPPPPSNTPPPIPTVTDTPCPPTITPTVGPPPQPPGIKRETWDAYVDLWYLLRQENSPYLMPDGKLDDQYLVATLIKIEIESALREITSYRAALEAISYHYHNFGCEGECKSLQQQLEWMDSMQNWWDRRGRSLPVISDDCYCWDDAALAINGYQDSQPAQSYWWGNPLRGFELAEYIRENYPSSSYQPYSLMVDNNKFIVGFRGTEESGVLDFVVVTKQQNDDCYSKTPNCMGFSLP